MLILLASCWSFGALRNDTTQEEKADEPLNAMFVLMVGNVGNAPSESQSSGETTDRVNLPHCQIKVLRTHPYAPTSEEVQTDEESKLS